MRRRGDDMDLFLPDRMDEADASGMKGDAAIRVGSCRPVFKVSLDMYPEGRQLGADLVMPAGMEVNLKEMIMVRGCKHPVG